MAATAPRTRIVVRAFAMVEPTEAMIASTIRIVRAVALAIIRAFAMVEPAKVVSAPPIRIARAVALALALAVVEW